MPTVCSVVLTWNGLADTLACLESLAAASHPFGAHRVILVDNASTDGTVEAVRARFPAVDVIANARNLGYAVGCNVGMRAALDDGARDAADYVWLLNNDVTVAPEALAEMVRVAERDGRVGVVGPRVRTPQGVDELGAWVDFSDARIIPASGQDALPDGERLPVDYVWGCAMLIRARVLREIGLFDERFVAYFEDADLCWRAHCAGYAVTAALNAVVWHAGARAADRRPLWQLWRRAMGRLRFFWKHAPRGQRWGALAKTVLREWPLLLAGTWLRYRKRARRLRAGDTAGRA